MPSLMSFLYLFVFLVETGFRHVGQPGLELLTSGDLPASASQSAGIIGVSHCIDRDPPYLFVNRHSTAREGGPPEAMGIFQADQGQSCPQTLDTGQDERGCEVFW